jgi:hypothetical protein
VPLFEITYIAVFTIVLAFIFGTVLASFITCTAGRVLAGEDWTRGFSHCDTCGHQLGTADLFPVISYTSSSYRARSLAKLCWPERVYCPLMEYRKESSCRASAVAEGFTGRGPLGAQARMSAVQKEKRMRRFIQLIFTKIRKNNVPLQLL